MIKKLFITVFSINLLLGCQLIQKNDKNLTFSLYAPSLSNDSVVYITGSHELLGNWNPGKIKMESQGHHIWEISVPITQAEKLEYKYTLGSWAIEGANGEGYPLSNFVMDDTLIRTKCDTVFNWTSNVRIFEGQITGMVKYHKNIEYKGLLPHDVIVWLPPDYEINNEKRYPVLYMMDGQNIIDPATSSLGTDWQADEICDSLIKNKIISPLIIVGINNTQQRSEEYLPGDTAQLFMDMVIDKIKPLIDLTYRTKLGKEFNWTAGSSAGATIAFMLAWEHSEVFSKAMCMSPAFKIKKIDYVDDVLAYKGQKKQLKFYVDNGGYDIEVALQPGIDEMLKALNSKGYKKNIDYKWVKEIEGYHSEADWARRFPEAIQFICNE